VEEERVGEEEGGGEEREQRGDPGLSSPRHGHAVRVGDVMP
jgi:hypothetical protein